MSISPEAVKAAVAVLTASYSAISASGKNGLPSGHLYARLMPYIDLDGYNKMIKLMVDKKMITVKNDVLYVVVN